MCISFQIIYTVLRAFLYLDLPRKPPTLLNGQYAVSRAKENPNVQYIICLVNIHIMIGLARDSSQGSI